MRTSHVNLGGILAPMLIERVMALSAAESRGSDFGFEVVEEAAAPFDGPGLARAVRVARYTKPYPTADRVLRSSRHGMIAVVRDRKRVVARVVVSIAWNGCAQVDDLAVDRRFRRRGLAWRLMDEASLWAKEHGLPALRLETQSTNVPACRFYERYGFELCGFDRRLYAAMPPLDRETALYWFLPLAKKRRAKPAPRALT